MTSTPNENRSQGPVWLGTDQRGWNHVRLHVEVMKDRRLGAMEIAVYAGLAVHAELNSGHCFPAIDTLASYVNAHPRTVSRALVVLKDTGWIDVEDRRGKASEYRLLPPPAISPPLTESAGVVIPTPDTDREHPRQKVQGTPDTDRDEREPMNQNQELGPAVDNSSCPRCSDDLGAPTGFIEHSDGTVEPCDCSYRVPTPSDPIPRASTVGRLRSKTAGVSENERDDQRDDQKHDQGSDDQSGTARATSSRPGGGRAGVEHAQSAT